MRFLQLLLACGTLLFAGFCIFGFLASFEAVQHAHATKIGYAALAVASLAASAKLSLAALRGPPRFSRERGGAGAH